MKVQKWQVVGTDSEGYREPIKFGYSMKRDFVWESDAVLSLHCSHDDLVAQGYTDLAIRSEYSLDMATEIPDNKLEIEEVPEVVDTRFRKDDAPDNARVAYGARWIDNQNNGGVPSPVPDRQGWKYTNEDDRDLLLPAIKYLASNRVRSLDFVTCDDGYYGCTGADLAGAKVSLFVNGGYVYVEVWM
tara:strand:- start:655 stop:1215 length:561 start_codon:yes stop_codon:yes gene_type:complete